MEAACPWQVHFFQTTRHEIPENGNLHCHQKDCLRLYKIHFAFEFYDSLWFLIMLYELT
jgi:hypothetical protein